jgi:hypothetical protein
VTSVDIIGTKSQLTSVASSGKTGTKTDLVATSNHKTGTKTGMEAISMESVSGVLEVNVCKASLLAL